MTTRTLLSTIAAAGCTLLAATPAHAERDYSAAAYADPGALLRADLPIAIEQFATTGTVTATVSGTLVAGDTTVTIAPATFEAPAGTTRTTLPIAQETIDAARAAAAAAHVTHAKLLLTVTVPVPGHATDPAWGTMLTVGTPAPATARQRLVPGVPGPAGAARRLRPKAITFAPGARWHAVPGMPSGDVFSTQLSDRCTVSFSRYASMVRSRNVTRALKNHLISAPLRQRLRGTVPAALGVYQTDDQTQDGLRAVGAVKTGTDTYAFLQLEGRLGAGCTPGQDDAALAALGAVLKTARPAR